MDNSKKAEKSMGLILFPIFVYEDSLSWYKTDVESDIIPYLLSD